MIDDKVYDRFLNTIRDGEADVGTIDMSEAARRVAEGGAPLKDSIVEWRSPFVRKAKS